MKTLTLSSVDSSVSMGAAPQLHKLHLGAALRERLVVLHRSSPVLSWAGWLNVGLVGLALVLLPFDHRVVTGLNVWIKPLKFAASSVIYLWTLGWLLADLPAKAQRAVRFIAWGVSVSMLVEMLCIYLQAYRGTTSHFNISSAFDGLIFGLMGMFIMLNTLLVIWALGLSLRHRPFGSAGYVWGMRLGLLLFLVGSAIGGSMVSHMGHTIGAADGGPGLPVLGWSTRYGDLRAAHFLGLHSLQALPLAGWWLHRYAPRWRNSTQTLSIFAFAGLYAGAVGLLYWRAMQGLPLIALH
ncbi:hypothetical protein [Hymenobacter sp. BT491]|uniref:hypothetical protein n=1 Tax=Hymenobacter sp. BT491 TaxID=2766779 RepID=UPI001CA3FB47|nr:hypothetical protein [Hymenobacter sp. BT491]